MNTFILKITQGNAAMQDKQDVIAALKKVISRLNDGLDSGIMRDINGNRVGSWSYDFEENNDSEN